MFSAQRWDVNKIFEGIPQRAERRRNTIKTLRNSGDSVDFTTAIIVFGTQSSQKPHAMISNGDIGDSLFVSVFIFKPLGIPKMMLK